MRWRVGYVPLVDAAVLVAAAERGFAAEAGVELELVPQPSWAASRDALALGHLDAAHMLAPLAVAASLGLSGPRVDLVAPLALNLNGNAVTLSLDLFAAMAEEGALDTWQARARAFVAVARRRAEAGRRLTLATVFPFSSHTYQLGLFAAAGGGRLEELARVVVVPPQRTAAALGEGAIDGFCVGAPWNSVAVAAGTGRIAAFGCEIAPDCPEKVLAMPRAARGRAAPLLAALGQAARWCGEPRHRAELAALLAEPRHLDVPAALILRALEGRLTVSPRGETRVHERYLVLDAPALPEHARWIVGAMAAAGQVEPDPATLAAAAAVYA